MESGPHTQQTWHTWTGVTTPSLIEGHQERWSNEDKATKSNANDATNERVQRYLTAALLSANEWQLMQIYQIYMWSAQWGWNVTGLPRIMDTSKRKGKESEIRFSRSRSFSVCFCSPFLGLVLLRQWLCVPVTLAPRWPIKWESDPFGWFGPTGSRQMH